MKKYLLRDAAMSQDKSKVVLFIKVKPKKDTTVLRPGKTHKDKNVTKAWYNRAANQQSRASDK